MQDGVVGLGVLPEAATRDRGEQVNSGTGEQVKGKGKGKNIAGSG